LGRLLRLGQSGVDLEASEMAVRGAMHQIGGVVLEKVINADGGGYRGKEADCEQGHRATFLDYRDKDVLTVVGEVPIERAYYHCEDCGSGVIPKDRELNIEGTTFSPGIRRLMGRVGGKESFQAGRQDLEELAGVQVTAKQVERVAEAIGVEVEAMLVEERKSLAGFSAQVVPLKVVPKLYIAYDGTGVPVVRRETEGRRGKQESGQAKTREAKLGCAFTQTQVNEEGQPVRDEDSTSYIGAIETAEEFGLRIYAEAMRRGLLQAQRVIVLGDGSPWIWGIADEHFPEALQIVDLYHAREHLANPAKIVYGPTHSEGKQWLATRYQELDAGKVETILGALRRLKSPDDTVQKQIEKQIHYFQANAERMRYAEFRRQGLFVGSGVIEAGCKTIVGLRLKQSGMKWTVRGANAIIALRCLDLSGRWEEFWENRAVGQ
jgi:Uncharacterised protein family (UPF0236)